MSQVVRSVRAGYGDDIRIVLPAIPQGVAPATDVADAAGVAAAGATTNAVAATTTAVAAAAALQKTPLSADNNQ